MAMVKQWSGEWDYLDDDDLVGILGEDTGEGVTAIEGGDERLVLGVGCGYSG